MGNELQEAGQGINLQCCSNPCREEEKGRLCSKNLRLQCSSKFDKAVDSFGAKATH